MKYFLGIDNGGTNTKAAIMDCQGREIGSFNQDTDIRTPKPGFAERCMEEMWESNCKVIRGVLEKTGIAPEAIAAVGVSGHGKGLYLWGKHGKPVGYGISSSDQRAMDIVERWKRDKTEEKVYEISYQHIMACQPVSLLAWMKENERDKYDEIRWVFACKDYIRFRLTEEAGAERSDYSGANLLNLRTKEYDPELLCLFGIEEMADCLPPLCKADEIVGEISADAAEQTGLQIGTPVIGGMFDINACAIGSGVTEGGKICMIAGTWSINEYVRREPVLDRRVLMNSLFALNDHFLIEESSPTSAGNLEWFIRQFMPELREELRTKGKNIHTEIDEWVEQVKVEEDIPVFLPFIMGSNVHPKAKGCLIGMQLRHTRKHIVRAFFEGITFCHYYHLEKLLATVDSEDIGDGKFEVSSEDLVIRLSGGASKADVWAQMFADVCKIPVETLEAGEVGALGCAIACAKAIGEYPSIEIAVQNMVRVAKRFEPDMEKAKVYQNKYIRYKRLIECLNGEWNMFLG